MSQNYSDWAKNLENFKLAVDNASDHIVITDPDGTVLYVNKAAEATTGYTAAEILGKKAGSKDTWGGNMSKEFYEEMWHTLVIEKKQFKARITNRRKNGQKYVADAAISPVLSPENKVEFFVAVEKDITKEIELDESKTEFFSLMSHQLRAPITSINWYTELLMSGGSATDEKKIKAYLESIRTASKNMSNLLDSLLKVSKVQLDKWEYRLENIDFPKLLDEQIEELMPVITDKKLELQIIGPSKLVFVSDLNTVNTTLQNLISNAVKYSYATGKVTIRYDLIKNEEGINQLNFEVEDQGCGIPKSEQGNVFTKQFRGTNARIYDVTGNGLGLFLVKNILTNLGGKISFTSEIEKGSTFRVTLPVNPVK